jgi:hypothetical protein
VKFAVLYLESKCGGDRRLHANVTAPCRNDIQVNLAKETDSGTPEITTIFGLCPVHTDHQRDTDRSCGQSAL